MLAGIGWPAYLVSAGFGSNKSMWLGPPCMNNQITRFAFGAKCGPRDVSSASSFDTATLERPVVAVVIHWRRDNDGKAGDMGSDDDEEFPILQASGENKRTIENGP